jgi:formate dehydrogenase subunit beta
MSSAVLKVENGDVLGTLRGVLGRMLESGFVKALLVPKELPGGRGFAQSLVRDPAQLADANPLAPTMAVQSASILSDLTATPAGGRIGAVLKPCELRAAVELSKFLQVKLDDLVTVGVDCQGTYEVAAFGEMTPDQRTAGMAELLSGGGGNGGIREACRICEYPAPVGADVTLGFLGAPAGEIAVVAGPRFEQELGEQLSLELGADPSWRAGAVEKAAAARRSAREKALAEMKPKADSLEQLLETFSNCIRCHNCMNVCPICYCKECVFKSAVMERRAEQLLKLAERKGAVRMPADTLMFHLTRLSHMATSCVSCGMCDTACPSGLPVSSLFSLVGGDLQKMFEYVPGRDASEEPPVAVFREKELEAVTGGH